MGSYTGVFKVRVVEHMLDKGLSLTEACSLFGVPNLNTIYRWRRDYEVHGSHFLLLERRGRKPPSMVGKKKKQAGTNLSPEVQQLAALQAEVEWLRAENDFLKKLDALIREKEAQDKQKKEQKPSKD
jgi:transposase-like protein